MRVFLLVRFPSITDSPIPIQTALTGIGGLVKKFFIKLGEGHGHVQRIQEELQNMKLGEGHGHVWWI